MGSRKQGNYGGSGKPLTRKLWAISKRSKEISYNDIKPLHGLAFTTKEEVENYLGGEYVECLICGKKCLKLGVHLSQYHKVDPKKYKLALGLPVTKGLAAKSVIKKTSEFAREFHKQGRANVLDSFGHDRKGKGNSSNVKHPKYWYDLQRNKAYKRYEGKSEE